MKREPTMSVSEVAKVFFGRSPYWLRWRERNGDLILRGTPVAIDRSYSNQRRYTLEDVEALAAALKEHRAIGPEQYRLAMEMVNAVRTVWVMPRGSTRVGRAKKEAR